MEKKHRACKICNRKFANGNAMGGHMRSHFVKLPLPPKPTLPSSSAPPQPPQPSESCPTLSPSSEVNHMRQAGSADLHGFSNETDSAKNPTGRKSKRLRKLPSDTVVGSPSPSDSVSSVVLSAYETLSIEDAARCLLTLLRDKGTRTSTGKRKQGKPEVYEFIIHGDEDLMGDENMDEEDEDEYDDDELYCITKHGAKANAKYKCDTCNKVFKSHQALGGHRATHKNKQILRDEDGDEESERDESKGGLAGGAGAGDNQIHQRRIFECPFCDKMFHSGQALGGHKKVHFTFLPVPNKASNEYEPTSSSSAAALQFFDLNQPAPEDDHP